MQGLTNPSHRSLASASPGCEASNSNQSLFSACLHEKTSRERHPRAHPLSRTSKTSSGRGQPQVLWIKAGFTCHSRLRSWMLKQNTFLRRFRRRI